jgi:hypothetical protein
MTFEFAMRWAFAWLAAFGLFSLVGIITRWPPLPSEPWCMAIGAAWGIVMTAPIVWVSFRR